MTNKSSSTHFGYETVDAAEKQARVREVFDLPPEMKVLYGLSFGYEDTSMSVNNAVTDRASVAENVRFRS